LAATAARKATARAGEAKVASATAAAPKSTAWSAIHATGGTGTAAFGAMNTPHTTAISSGAPTPSSACTATPSPVVKPQYRAFALEHPHLYRLMLQGRLPRERLVPGAEERAAAPVIAAVGGDPDRARAVFAFAHGMVILELDDRFPPGADLTAAWARGLSAFSA
jgi:Tetracyclin repressor-like, C-terminal domain